jgi:hypothetical protein
LRIREEQNSPQSTQRKNQRVKTKEGRTEFTAEHAESAEKESKGKDQGVKNRIHRRARRDDGRGKIEANY